MDVAGQADGAAAVSDWLDWFLQGAPVEVQLSSCERRWGLLRLCDDDGIFVSVSHAYECRTEGTKETALEQLAGIAYPRARWAWRECVAEDYYPWAAIVAVRRWDGESHG